MFLPWINGKAKTKDERRKGYHEGPAFQWPDDRVRIEEWLAGHDDDDVYFTPSLFEIERRGEDYAVVERALWADLDEVDPNAIDYRPTIAWESSPGRYQAVWLMHKPRTGLSWPGDINHRLTRYLGADPSGWDTTQLLRVPGRKNWKFVYDGGAGVQGQLLWDNGPRYTVDEFDDLPVIPADETDVDLFDEDFLATVDRHEVWARVRLKISMKVREYMGFRRASQITEDMDRSEIQWQIMRELADAGCNVAEIVAIIKPTVWNSYAGRGDELKRLKIGASRAVNRTKADEESDTGGALEEITDDKPEIRWLTDVMSVRMRRPRWLVNNVWSEGGCGFIAGDPKSYKSWMGLDMAVSIATGTPFLGDDSFVIPGGPRPMLYLQEEDSEIVVRDRLDNIVEGKCPHLHWHGRMSWGGDGMYWDPPAGDIPLGFHVRTGFIVSDPGWQAWLVDMLSTHSFAGFIVDTLGTTAGDVDTDRASDLMTKILRPMREISHQTSTAVIVVHHNRKGSGGNGERGGQRMLGSVALHAWVDDAMYVHSRERVGGGVTKVRVERESKGAVEHRWVVEVPRMGMMGDGTRIVWSPTTGVWDASEGGVTGDHDVPTPTARTTGKRVAGTNAMYHVRRLNGTEEHPVPIARLASVNGTTEGQMWKQVNAAIANGLIAGTREGGVWVVEK